MPLVNWHVGSVLPVAKPIAVGLPTVEFAARIVRSKLLLSLKPIVVFVTITLMRYRVPGAVLVGINAVIMSGDFFVVTRPRLTAGEPKVPVEFDSSALKEV